MASGEDPKDPPAHEATRADEAPRAHEATREAELTAEALARLQERLDRASEAAERLIAEAARAAVGKPPPAGWQRREPHAEDDKSSRWRPDRGAWPAEIELLLEALRALRDRIPPELQRRVSEALREVLVALRAAIDWYLEQTDRRHAEPTEVHDIPIV